MWKARAEVGVIEGNGRPENPRAVEYKVAALNPDFPETKTHRQIDVRRLAGGVEQRQLQIILILRVLRSQIFSGFQGRVK